MDSYSSNRKSQFEILDEELMVLRSSFEIPDLPSLLRQMNLVLNEADLVGDGEELQYANPIEILRGHLIGISDPRALAEWHAVLSLYLFDRIQEFGSEFNAHLIELALQSLNISKNYSEEAERQKKAEKRRQSAAAISANEKKNKYLEMLKKAAFKEYEPAIRSIQKSNEAAAAPAVITYLNVAKIVYPKIEHLNRNAHGRKLIGRSTQKQTKTKATPITALAALFKRAVAKNILRSPVEYR